MQPHRALAALPALLAIAIAVAGGIGLAVPARAATTGDTVLLSGPPGLAAPTPADFAWNASPLNADGDVGSDMTPDGRYVTFASAADGLVTAAEDRRYANIFVKDRQTGQLIDVTAGANGSSYSPTISDDGSLVAFETQATNLVAGDSTGATDIVVRNLSTGVVTLITEPGNGGCLYPCMSPALSGNGARVAFTTTGTYAVADTNGFRDVYTRPASGGGTTRLVSAATIATGNAGSDQPSISDDGQVVAFRSEASNLVAADGNGKADVFVRDTATPPKTVLASAVTVTSTAGNGRSREPVLSGDGNYVAFSSEASNLGDGDSDTAEDVHRRKVDRAATAGGATALVSRLPPANAKGNAASNGPQISDNGQVVSFRTSASNIPAGGGEGYVRDMSGAGSTAALGAGPFATVLALNATGTLRAVADATFSPALEPGLAVVDAGAASREIVSRLSDGTPLVPKLTETAFGSAYGEPHALSHDGRYAVFASGSPALPDATTDPATGSRVIHIYRRDNLTGAVTLVSRDTGADGTPARWASAPSISADGGRVAFLTPMNLAGSTGVHTKAFVRNLTTSTTVLASQPSGNAGPTVNANVDQAQISADGTRVLFTTDAQNLDNSHLRHVYVRDLAATTTVLADRADGPAGAVSAAAAGDASISGNGRRVAFSTSAPNLGDGATPGVLSIHVRDLDAGTTVLASRAAGAAGAPALASSANPVLSADGTAVAFETDAEDLDPSAAPWPKGASSEVVVRDLGAATTTLVSRAPGVGGVVADDDATRPSISADGTAVAYESYAGNLGGGDTVFATAVYVRTVASGAQSRVGISGLSDPGEGVSDRGVLAPGLSGDGRCLAFSARGIGILDGVSPDYQQAFMRVLDGGCGTPQASPTSPPGATTPTLPTQSPALPAPRLSAVRLTRARFRVSTRATAASAVVTKRRRVSAHRTPSGTTIRFTLNTAATVRFTLSRRVTGRLVGKTCRAATRKLAGRRRCTRYVGDGTLTRKAQPAGARTLAFSGRVGRRALKPGRHRIVLLATGPTGRRSAAVTRTFTVAAR